LDRTAEMPKRDNDQLRKTGASTAHLAHQDRLADQDPKDHAEHQETVAQTDQWDHLAHQEDQAQWDHEDHAERWDLQANQANPVYNTKFPDQLAHVEPPVRWD
uniref:HNH endonuclease n=1 Tax=Anisakis simplex TaxID=6269 RepID=A0A0M3JKB7_ANISI